MLDIGCGRTFPLAGKWLETGASVFGIDPVADPGKVSKDVKVFRGNAQRIPFGENYFDVIISCAVLEHIEYPIKLFNECRRALKPGGKVIFLTPSRFDYVSIAAEIIPNSFHGKIVNATEGRDESDTFPTFYRINSFHQFKRVSNRTGLKILSFKYLDQSPYILKNWTPLYKIACAYHHLVRTIPILKPLNGWILCTIEKPKIS